jgi:hypothetical protein
VLGARDHDFDGALGFCRAMRYPECRLVEDDVGSGDEPVYEVAVTNVGVGEAPVIFGDGLQTMDFI